MAMDSGEEGFLPSNGSVPEDATTVAPELFDQQITAEATEDDIAEEIGEAAHKLWRIVTKLSCASLIGFIYEALHYDQLLKSGRVVRSFEGSAADGGQYLGDGDLSGYTFAQRLAFMLRLPAPQLQKQLVLEDSKLFGVQNAWHLGLPSERTKGAATTRAAILLHGKQAEIVSHLHVSFLSAPGLVAVFPTPDRSLKFQDILSYHMPIPPVIAACTMPLAKLPVAHERLQDMYTGNTSSYTVPGSGVVLQSWQPALDTQKQHIAGVRAPYDAAKRAFDFVREAIEASPYGRSQGLALEFAKFQPLDGDGTLRHPSLPEEHLELKDGVARERNGMLEISQALGSTAEVRRRLSAFHPLRKPNFLCILSKMRDWMYCIPAEVFREEWWTGEDEVHIDLHLLSSFRIDIADDEDWFARVHQRIILAHPHSVRLQYPVRPSTFAEDYAVAKMYLEDEPEDEIEPEADEDTSKGNLFGYPWWKIERWNHHCAERGYGVFLPLGREEKIANVGFFGYTWSVQDQIQYRAIRKLPVACHTGDLSPLMPLFVIRAMCIRSHKSKLSPDYAFNVSGRNLDPGPFPALFYVDCSTWSMRGVESSGYLIPSEFVDYEYLRRVYSEWLGTPVRSARQFMRELKADPKTASDAWHIEAHLTDLRKCVRVPISGLMVREGNEFFDAVCSFADAHREVHKLLSWFDHYQLYAKTDYRVRFRDLLQKFADRWIPTLNRAEAEDEEDDESDEESDEFAESQDTSDEEGLESGDASGESEEEEDGADL